MLFKLQLTYLNWRRLRSWAGFPYVSLLFWILPLLLFSSGQSSLMAHDEGLYAWRSRQMFESGDWINPWSDPHHKTPGPYWLIASSYTLFGISEASVRLPSMIFGIFSVLLLYEIGKIILGQKIGWLAAAIFSVEFLWLQYCRLGTPDVPTIFLVLLAIWSLLKVESNPKYSYFYSFTAGLCFGLGFLVRSFMIFLPMIALLPYLVWENRRHRHLTNPMLYVGILFGFTPILIWLWLSYLRYDNDSIAALFNFVFRLSSDERHNNGLEFYFWNVPLKAFPWAFFGLIGLVRAILRPIPRYSLILVGFPLLVFTEISLFSTRLSHYSLFLYPFIALLAAVGLNWLSNVKEWESGRIADGNKKNTLLLHQIRKLPRNLSYAFGGLGILLLLASIVAFALLHRDIHKYAILALAVGSGWLILPLVWIGRNRLRQTFLTSGYWIAGWLIPAWLALAVAASTGLLENYNPDVKSFLQQPAIAQILQNYPIHFVQVGGKTGVLLNFYTPHHGKRVEQVSELPAFSYVWISTKKKPEILQPYHVLGTVQEVQLIQLLKPSK